MDGDGTGRARAQPLTVARAEALLGTRAETWERVDSRGYSKNEHWKVGFADGSRAFLKTGTIDPSPGWIREERRILEALGDTTFSPRLLAFEDGDAPLLVLEDLISAYWPPPWRDGDVELVRTTLAEAAATTIEGLPRIEDFPNGWRRVEEDPAPFLSTGLRDARWLERRLPELVADAERTPLGGDALVHGDVRSDNLCIKDGRCVLVDWNHASLGNPKFDIAAWAPSLALENGPHPWTLGVDEFSVIVAGFFASLAGLPKPPGAPTVRVFQRAQAEVALDWVERVL
jgi:hypothetical protein